MQRAQVCGSPAGRASTSWRTNQIVPGSSMRATGCGEAMWDGGEFDAARDPHELVITTNDGRRAVEQISEEAIGGNPGRASASDRGGLTSSYSAAPSHEGRSRAAGGCRTQTEATL